MQGDQGELWVFGYGSLMWRPDFPFVASTPARLDGWHRRFCIVSRYYRGSDVRPGLVLGLDRGGVCQGRAYRIAPEEAEGVLAYLQGARTDQWRLSRGACRGAVAGRNASARQWAVTFIAERAHPSFTPPLSLRAQAAIIAGARGSTGSNIAYFLETLKALRDLSIREDELERLLVEIGPVTARRSGGEGAGSKAIR